MRTASFGCGYLLVQVPKKTVARLAGRRYIDPVGYAFGDFLFSPLASFIQRLVEMGLITLSLVSAYERNDILIRG